MSGFTRVQQVVHQARATFTKARSDPSFLEEYERLKKLLNLLTPGDFNVTPAVVDRQWDYRPYVTDSPASCMEIYQCPEFSVGIFLLKPQKAMPLHDHPGMHGVMKVLFGSMMVTSYSKPNPQTRPPFKCKFVGQTVLTPSSDPCCVFPEESNIHEIQANSEPVAFLDILAPPYDPQKGRDCTYYFREMKKGQDSGDDRSVYLRPGSSPEWFSCVPLPYSGPPAS